MTNLQWGTKSDMRILPHGMQFYKEVVQACSLLTEQDWLFQELQGIDSKNEKRWGLAFAHPARLSILQKRSWFTQFDST